MRWLVEMVEMIDWLVEIEMVVDEMVDETDMRW